jgi:hypothetical protein
MVSCKEGKLRAQMARSVGNQEAVRERFGLTESAEERATRAGPAGDKEKGYEPREL